MIVAELRGIQPERAHLLVDSASGYPEKTRCFRDIPAVLKHGRNIKLALQGTQSRETVPLGQGPFHGSARSRNRSLSRNALEISGVSPGRGSGRNETKRRGGMPGHGRFIYQGSGRSRA